MKVKMRTKMAGPNISAAPGDVVDLPHEIAADLVRRGYAEPADQGLAPEPAGVRDSPVPEDPPEPAKRRTGETAMHGPARNAAVKRGRGRPRHGKA